MTKIREDFEEARERVLDRLTMFDRLDRYISYDGYRTLDGYNEIENIVVLPDLFQTIGVAFTNSKEIEEIKTNKHLEVIERNAFNGCENLKSVVLNEGLKRIRNGAFAFTAISEIVLPSTLEVLAANSIRSENLTDIYVLSNHIKVKNVYSACSKSANKQTNKIKVHFRKDRLDIDDEKLEYKNMLDAYYNTIVPEFSGYSNFREHGDMLEVLYDL